MKNKKLIACASLFTAFVANNSFAKESYDDRFYISPSATYLGLDDDRMTSRSGHGFSLGLGKAVNKNINLEVKAIYNRYQHQSNKNPSTQYQWDTFGGALDVQYYLWRETFSPYFAISAGAMDSNISGQTAMGFIGDAGIGLDYKISDNLSLRSDIRYRYNDNFSKNITTGNRARYNDMVVNVGFVIPLGSKKIEAPISRKQPVAKEVKPAKTINPDIDGDGVANNLDKCPNTNIGSVVDKNGCELPTPNLTGTKFKINSATLTSEYKTTLDKIAENLIAYPKKGTIEIQGHASSLGSDQYNKVLSQKRAQSVADHLKSKGVTNEIIVKGYGETMPIADNSTAEGREKNRRVAIIWK